MKDSFSSAPLVETALQIICEKFSAELIFPAKGCILLETATRNQWWKMKNNKTSPFAGIKIGWLELDTACRPEISCDGKKLDPIWKKDAENRFSAELDFGILNLEIISSPDGIRICSS